MTRKRCFFFVWKIIAIMFLELFNKVGGCGSELTGLEGTVTHTEYPDDYGPNTNCEWTTTARERDKVFLEFELLDVEADQNGGCTYDYVSVQFPSENNPKKFCGQPQSRDPNEEIKTDGTGNPTIKFETDDSVEYKGFVLHFRIERYDYCLSQPCQNGGSCELDESEEEGWRCDCASGWIGTVCDEDLDECDEEPCENGGSCTTPQFDMYLCTCVEGFTGDICDVEVDECESEPCQHGGTCLDGQNSYTCTCADGFTGDICEIDIDECESNPCENEAQCHDDVNGFNCECQPGYDGTLCEQDIDECESSPCENEGSCEDGIDQFTCTCKDGYEGEMCEEDINECSSDPCVNGGTCEDGVNRYTCNCPEGFTSQDCEFEIDECDCDPCQNGGSCIDRQGAYECICSKGYVGTNCETFEEPEEEKDPPKKTNNDDQPEKDACTPNPCVNGGTCSLLSDDFSCHCSDGYRGKTCSDTSDDWHSHAHLLSAILPSLIFLILGIIIAGLFYVYLRKKRSSRFNRVRIIDVKPEDKLKPKKVPKDKLRKPMKRSNKKKKKKPRSDKKKLDSDSSDIISVIDNEESLSRKPMAHVKNVSQTIPQTTVQPPYFQYDGIVHQVPNLPMGMMNGPNIHPGMFQPISASMYNYNPQRNIPQQFQPQINNPMLPEHSFLYPSGNNRHSLDKEPYYSCYDNRPSYDYFDESDETYSISSRQSATSSGRRTQPRYSETESEYAPERTRSNLRHKRNSDDYHSASSSPSRLHPQKSYKEPDPYQQYRNDNSYTRRNPNERSSKGHWQERDNDKLHSFPSTHRFYNPAEDVDPEVVRSLKKLGKIKDTDHRPRYFRNSGNAVEPIRRQKKVSFLNKNNSTLFSGLRQPDHRKPTRRSKYQPNFKTLTPIAEDPLRELDETEQPKKSPPRLTKEYKRDSSRNPLQIPNERHSPEGSVSAPQKLADKSPLNLGLIGRSNLGQKKDWTDKADSKSPALKLVRRSNTLNVNRGRGFARENAFIQTRL